MSLRKELYNKIRESYPLWINGTELEDLSRLLKYKASNASRRLRHLEEVDKYIRVRLNDHRCVEYQWIIGSPINPGPESNKQGYKAEIERKEEIRRLVPVDYRTANNIS